MYNKFAILFDKLYTQSEKTKQIHQIFYLISFDIRKNKTFKKFFDSTKRFIRIRNDFRQLIVYIYSESYNAFYHVVNIIEFNIHILN